MVSRRRSERNLVKEWMIRDKYFAIIQSSLKLLVFNSQLQVADFKFRRSLHRKLINLQLNGAMCKHQKSVLTGISCQSGIRFWSKPISRARLIALWLLRASIISEGLAKVVVT